MNFKKLIIGMATSMMLLTACGGGNSSSESKESVNDSSDTSSESIEESIESEVSESSTDENVFSSVDDVIDYFVTKLGIDESYFVYDECYYADIDVTDSGLTDIQYINYICEEMFNDGFTLLEAIEQYEDEVGPYYCADLAAGDDFEVGIFVWYEDDVLILEIQIWENGEYIPTGIPADAPQEVIDLAQYVADTLDFDASFYDCVEIFGTYVIFYYYDVCFASESSPQAILNEVSSKLTDLTPTGDAYYNADYDEYEIDYQISAKTSLIVCSYIEGEFIDVSISITYIESGEDDIPDCIIDACDRISDALEMDVTPIYDDFFEIYYFYYDYTGSKTSVIDVFNEVVALLDGVFVENGEPYADEEMSSAIYTGQDNLEIDLLVYRYDEFITVEFDFYQYVETDFGDYEEYVTYIAETLEFDVNYFQYFEDDFSYFVTLYSELEPEDAIEETVAALSKYTLDGEIIYDTTDPEDPYYYALMICDDDFVCDMYVWYDLSEQSTLVQISVLPNEGEGGAGGSELEEDGVITASLDFTKMADNTKFTSQTVGNVTFSCNVGTGNNEAVYLANGNALRIYWGNKFTITVPEGYEILSVQISYSNSNSKDIIPSSSNMTFTNATANFGTGTLTLNPTNGATEVGFHVGGTSGRFSVTGISVTYQVK